ncbi:MAG: serine/threonine-protein kinase [Planctomycetota bacterium]|nr:serine/threonine-protein kinase [Planctomycetota bacterium]
MQCPHCNARIAADAGRCAACGRDLVAGAEAELDQTLYQDDETRAGPELDQTLYQDDDAGLVSGLDQTHYHEGETDVELQREEPIDVGSPPEWRSGPLDVTSVSPSGDPEPPGDRNAAAWCGQEEGRPPRGAALGEIQRFKPGTLLLDRYRIVARLGRGGMGEVYRADDLILEQPVALKFLVQGAEALGPRLEQLRAEVRLARQISHPNICAVYDIGEAQKTPFISMELIDGNDLQTLLESAEQLPSEQGLDLAKQIAAGIHAAHQKGIIHRDLKPANIMVDAQGQVRITDFGLAQLTVDGGSGPLAGTPAYMAPEQLRGEELSEQSDLYALGLILHELFSGQPAHEVSSLSQLIEIRSRDTEVALSEYNPQLDLAVEEVIEACLRHDRAIRIKSALTVFQMLPGNSPLEAALAMGHTPSPEQVAASVEQPLLSTSVIVSLLLAAVVSLVLNLALSEQSSLLSGAHFQASPAAMRTAARGWLDELGVPRLHHSSAGLRGNQGASDYAPSDPRLRLAWKKGRREYQRLEQPAAGWFWYRESQTTLRPREYLHVFSPHGVFKNHLASWDDPAITGADSLLLVRTPGGKLDTFRINLGDRLLPMWKPAEKPQREWIDELFREAGLRRSDFVDRVTDRHSLELQKQRWICPVAHDACFEWTGTYPNNPHLKLAVRMGLLRGRPVYFRVVPPWHEERTALADLPAVLFVTVLVGCLVLVPRNIRRRNADVAGAIKIGIVAFGVSEVCWLLEAPHHASLDELMIVVQGVVRSLFQALGLILAYLALEPLLRRLWPTLLVSWTRFMQGRWRDPLIGRDLLIAFTGSGINQLLYGLQFALADRLAPGVMPTADHLPFFAAPRLMLAMYGEFLLTATWVCLFYLMVFILLVKVICRRTLLAYLACIGVVFLLQLTSGDAQWFLRVTTFISVVMPITILMRWGILAAVSYFFANLTLGAICSHNIALWYGNTTLVSVLLFVLAVGCGARYALAGRSLLALRGQAE